MTTPSAARVASRYLEAFGHETEVVTYAIEMSSDVRARFDRFLAMLHLNASWGHSSHFGLWMDGDGPDVFAVTEGLEISEDVRDGVHAVGGIGGGLEIATTNGFGFDYIDQDRGYYWVVDEDGARKVLDEE